MITVDYGAGTPQEAADWVKYANKGGAGYNGPVPTYSGGSSTGHNYGIKYWEVGNEVYGNELYGGYLGVRRPYQDFCHPCLRRCCL